MSKFGLVALVLLGTVVGTVLAGSLGDGHLNASWMNASDPPQLRAHKLVSAMNFTEKTALLHASCGGYTGNVCGNSRLGIPPLRMNDGPQGFRGAPSTSTAFPAAVTIAASWDTRLARQWGAAMGDEFYRKGANVQLGPGLNVARVPNNGRNFEYISGEDPFLGMQMAPAVVAGIQSKGVIANAKHWVNNNQESDRHFISENVDERTQFEIYYPPFEGAIGAGLGSIMCSYNLIGQNLKAGFVGNWSCENSDTLKIDLKLRLGFDGWVMSDWMATHSTSIARGLDQEMPTARYMNNQTIGALVAAGLATEVQVSESAWRILWPLFAVGAFDVPNTNTPTNNVRTDANAEFAVEAASQGMVLLQNDGSLLPIRHGITTIAVIGSQADTPIVTGGGSGAVSTRFVLSPLASIQSYVNETLFPATVTYDPGSNLTSALELAVRADIVLVFAGTSSREGADRANLGLGSQDGLISGVGGVAKNKTAVVVVTPGAVLTDWRVNVSAVITAFMPGEGYGDAITSILFGLQSPAGKLPVTFPQTENEVGFTPQQWPGLHSDGNGTSSNVSCTSWHDTGRCTAVYSEALEVGYRWYSTHPEVQPAFPFGHGLSYTTWMYHGLVVRNRTIACSITNTGNVSGAEVAQLYLEFPKSSGEPPNQLKGFSKATVAAGMTVEISFELNDRSFSIWDANIHRWVVIKGEFGVMVGSSSADIRLNGHITIY